MSSLQRGYAERVLPLPYGSKFFVDLFAGAGCLSLGLMAAGWQGLFAVEKDSMAFDTLRHNLLQGGRFTYQWPDWLPKAPCDVSTLCKKYGAQLQGLRGKVTLVAGGPPCQGFSLAGRRNEADARNTLFHDYIRVVEAIEPLFVLLENVRGIDVEFGKKMKRSSAVSTKRRSVPYSQRIARLLRRAGYKEFAALVRAVDFGVPQMRPRYFLVGVRKAVWPSVHIPNPFDKLAALRESFLTLKGLPQNRPVSVKEAISDLETSGGRVRDCVDSPGFKQGVYSPPSGPYQFLMRGGANGELPDSHRLANHRPETVERFQQVLATCRRGVQLNEADRKRLGIKKKCVVPLDPAKPSHTLTTLPDDIIHYSEPRILTVREYARIQSIPDWFHFRGSYTTGGDRRVRQCPRYTQVGNAVPPLLGEALGLVLAILHDQFIASITSQEGSGSVVWQNG